MSEQPKEQGPPDISNASGSAPSQQHPPVSPAVIQQHAPNASTTTPISTSPVLQRQPAGNGRTVELPPLPQALTASSMRFATSGPRSAGVSSILNPQGSDELLQGRRRKASQLDSPTSTARVLPPLASSSHPSQSYVASTTPGSVHSMTSLAGDRHPRRILTPRSPSLHRAASLSHLQHHSRGTFSAQQTPFPPSPESRFYTVEPGTAGAPPLPTPPAGFRHQHGYPDPAPSNQSRRAVSIGTSRGMRPASQSTSPISSYSSYSQAEHTPPMAYAATSSMPTLSAGYFDQSRSYSGTVGAPGSVDSDRQRVSGIPISSSGGHNNYQMLTLETTSGTVQLPVDVQAASRVADEKRRRNAGASARFRQRRKEKEKEASTMISRLEQQVKELTEDMNFYKGEREYLAGVVLQVPGGERHFPRPQSPRRRRSRPRASHGGNSGAGYVPLSDSGAYGHEDERNVRRRTSTMSLPPPGQSHNLGPPHGHAHPPSYNLQTYPHPLAPQPPPHSSVTHGPPLPSPLPRGTLPAPPAQAGPPQIMQAPPQTGPWNPYADRRAPGPLGRENR